MRTGARGIGSIGMGSIGKLMTTALNGIDELADNFELLGDWESRFGYLIDLGKELPPMDDADKCEANRVWMKLVAEADGRITIVADSDAFIVKGLIAVLLTIYSGKTTPEILDTDAQAQLDRLQLASHLSPTRKNGLFAMVKRVRELAQTEGAEA
jgi:cysteine desulfuration protein SufE